MEGLEDSILLLAKKSANYGKIAMAKSGYFSEVAKGAASVVRWSLSQPLLGFGVGVGGGVAVGLGGVGVDVGLGTGGGG